MVLWKPNGAIIRQELEGFITSELTKLGFTVGESNTNFVLVKSNFKRLSSPKIVKELVKKNVFVRGLKNYGLKDFFRVSIGSASELEFFIKI